MIEQPKPLNWQDGTVSDMIGMSKKTTGGVSLAIQETPDLDLPEHIQAGRIRRDFGPFLSYCKSLAPAKDHRAFEQDLVDWLLTLPQDERNKTTKVLLFQAPLTLAGRPGLTRLTPAAKKVAASMLELFNLRKRG